jgi:hypothetical protein
MARWRSAMTGQGSARAQRPLGKGQRQPEERKMFAQRWAGKDRPAVERALVSAEESLRQKLPDPHSRNRRMWDC